ncbi:hypothetical protein FKM82_007981 [Ascaphus truei]
MSGVRWLHLETTSVLGLSQEVGDASGSWLGSAMALSELAHTWQILETCFAFCCLPMAFAFGGQEQPWKDHFTR